MERIAWGASSVIFKTADSHIIKQPFPENHDDLRYEQRAYRLLGPHPRIAKYRRSITDLVFEMEYYQNGCIDQARATTMKPEGVDLPFLRWAEQIAEALVFVHSNDIIHCDVRSANILVTDTFDVVLADFASCCINGMKVSTVVNNARCRPPSYERPDYQVSLQDDFFAFGSLVYDFVASENPYKDLTNDEVIKLYTQEIFPDVSKWPIGAVINKCWRGEYSSSAQILEDIR